MSDSKLWLCKECRERQVISALYAVCYECRDKPISARRKESYSDNEKILFYPPAPRVLKREGTGSKTLLLLVIWIILVLILARVI